MSQVAELGGPCFDEDKPAPFMVARVPRASTRRRARKLAEEIETFVAAYCPEADAITGRNNFVQELRSLLESEIPGCSLEMFGSATNGLWLACSDVDLSLQVTRVESRAESIRYLKRVGAVIHRLTGERPDARFGARIPILHWVPSRPGAPVCDISVNNLLAVANSRLIGAYVKLDGCVRPLVVVLKSWARARSINDRSNGTLSSFALTLMVIHFLQRRNLLPSLQDIAFLQDGSRPTDILGVDCRFCEDDVVIREEVDKLLGAAGREENLGGLLLAFLRYFGSEYKGGPVAIREHGASAQVQDVGPLFFVENPFEPGRDVANVEASQLLRLRHEFRRAHRQLLEGCSLVELLSPSTVSYSNGCS